MFCPENHSYFSCIAVQSSYHLKQNLLIWKNISRLLEYFLVCLFCLLYWDFGQYFEKVPISIPSYSYKQEHLSNWNKFNNIMQIINDCEICTLEKQSKKVFYNKKFLCISLCRLRIVHPFFCVSINWECKISSDFPRDFQDAWLSWMNRHKLKQEGY